VKNGITRRGTLGGLVGATVAPHITALIPTDQASELVRPENFFVAHDLTTAAAAGEAALAPGTYFKAVGTSEGLSEIRVRTASGSNLLYAEPTASALASTDPGKGAALINNLRPEADAVPMRVSAHIAKELPQTPFSFGGKGDGTTDNTGALLTTIERTGRLILPKGNFRCDGAVVTSALITSGNLFIAGQGSASTLDFAEGGLDLPGRSFRRGTIRDVHINASGTGQTLINLRNTDSSNWPVRWI